jgi:hypothetical protein
MIALVDDETMEEAGLIREEILAGEERDVMNSDDWRLILHGLSRTTVGAIERLLSYPPG